MSAKTAEEIRQHIARIKKQEGVLGGMMLNCTLKIIELEKELAEVTKAEK